MRHLARPASRRDDAGFSLVEVMVSMTLLAIILMALAPILINVTRVTARNATVAAATQIVNERIEEARASAGSCTTFLAYVNAPGPMTASDGRGNDFTITHTPAPGGGAVCTASTPLQNFSVRVTLTSTGETLGEAATIIAVPGIS